MYPFLTLNDGTLHRQYNALFGRGFSLQRTSIN